MNLCESIETRFKKKNKKLSVRVLPVFWPLAPPDNKTLLFWYYWSSSSNVIDFRVCLHLKNHQKFFFFLFIRLILDKYMYMNMYICLYICIWLCLYSNSTKITGDPLLPISKVCNTFESDQQKQLQTYTCIYWKSLPTYCSRNWL